MISRDRESGDAALFGFDATDERWLDELRRAERPGGLGRLGRYPLIEEVSRGGQGVVYRAFDPERARPVALKRLVAGELATATMRRRLDREMEAAGRLAHECIVPVLGIESADGHPVLVMEWINGTPVSEWARGDDGGRRSSRAIVEMIIKVCGAVHHAHQQGVLHRDLKPSNILVDAADVPHLLDFGLAKLLGAGGGDGGEADLTMSGQYMGTPVYSSPEQIRGGLRTVDVRADVYSLGVMLYEMLAAALPFPAGGTLATLFEVIQNEDPPRLCRGSVDRDLDAIVMMALAKRPEERYQSVDALRADLRRYLANHPVDARGQGTAYVARKLLRRHRRVFLAAASILLLVVALGPLMTVLYQRAESEADKSRGTLEFLNSLLMPDGGPRGDSAAVLHVARRAELRLASEPLATPEVEADIRHTLCRIYSGFWQWEKAATHASFVIDDCRRRGDDGLQLATALEVLGLARTFAGDPRAVPCQREALAIRRTRLGDDHWKVAATHGSLAFALWRTQNAFDEAGTHYRRSMDIYETSDVSHYRAGVLHGHAIMHMQLDQLDWADELCGEAVAAYEREGSRFPVPMIRCLENHALIRERLEQPREAERLLLEAIGRWPADALDPQLALTHLWVARLLQTRDAHAPAIGHLHEALAIFCLTLADTRPGDGAALREMATLIRDDQAGRLDRDRLWTIFVAAGERSQHHLGRVTARLTAAHVATGDTPTATIWTTAGLRHATSPDVKLRLQDAIDDAGR